MTKYYSDITDISWTESNKPHYHCTLAELFPNEIAFFKKRFVWPSNNAGCYVRYRYEKLQRPCEKPIPKWIPLKTRGNWQHLYPDLVNSLVEKHLHFEKFLKTSRLGGSRDRLSPDADETAFWFGTMAGEMTYNDCIDIDSHEQFGWNPLPTMWHFTRTGSVNGPYSWRFIPVVRPTLRFFQIAKVIYDNFPNRIWAFSSANFGLAVWKVYDQSEPTHVVYRKIEARLKATGLTLEHYPMPAITGLGRCHRRPCGMDSAIITDDGLITDSIQQIRAFMTPPRTPSFETILEACFDGLRQSYNLFLAEGESIAHKRMPDDEKKFRVESCLETLEVVRRWACDGYAIDLDLILEHKETSEDPADDETDHIIEFTDDVLENLSTSVSSSDEYPAFFWKADLKALSKAGQWVQFVKFLVDNGIPTEDKFSLVISTLAQWFGFVELFGEDRDRIKTVLRRFAVTRHNSRVSRLIAGQEEDVLTHVDRIVDHALDHESAEGKQLFAEIRQKRDNGEYKQVYFFEAEILGTEQDNLSPTSVPHSLSYLTCRGLIPESDETEHSPEWRYQPDDTPLPDEVMNRIVNAFKAVKRQIRRHGTTGRYSVLDSITRFYNYLFCGRKCGTRRASGELLIQMGFPKKTIERNQIISILLECGTLHQGGYRSGELSRQWFLDSEVIKAMQHSRIAARVVS